MVQKSSSESSLDCLPEAMINEMLDKYSRILRQVRNQIHSMITIKSFLREKLIELDLLNNINDLIYQNRSPNTFGVDGSYCIVKQLSIDTTAVAAVAIEGLVSPEEKRIGMKPDHRVDIFPVKHFSDTSKICRAIMFSYELNLATRVPKNNSVVFLDGSLISHKVGFQQALYAIKNSLNVPPVLASNFEDDLDSIINDYLTVLSSPVIDQIFVGIPKYSSRNEVIQIIKRKLNIQNPLLNTLNDKGVLSLVLREGDVVGPVPLTKDFWDLQKIPSEMISDKINNALSEISILYYKPSRYHPVIRLEVNQSVIDSEKRFSTLLEGLRDQISVPGIFEPYPIYIADLFVKQLYSSIRELKDVIISDVGVHPELDYSDVLLTLHEYRSEEGFY